MTHKCFQHNFEKYVVVRVKTEKKKFINQHTFVLNVS